MNYAAITSSRFNTELYTFTHMFSTALPAAHLNASLKGRLGGAQAQVKDSPEQSKLNANITAIPLTQRRSLYNGVT